jgi:hypothetical protein
MSGIGICGMCGGTITQPRYLPDLSGPVCVACYAMVASIMELKGLPIPRQIPPMPDSWNKAWDEAMGATIEPAGVQSTHQDKGPVAMRYMGREETIAYVSAWLRWVGSLAMSRPRFHKVLRLNAPQPDESPAPPKEDETP